LAQWPEKTALISFRMERLCGEIMLKLIGKTTTARLEWLNDQKGQP
jgi:hypothetical protein